MSPWCEVVVPRAGADYAGAMEWIGRELLGRGLHSSTFRLNVSPLWEIGGAVRGCFIGGVEGVLWGIRGCLGCILCQKRLRLS